MTRYFFHCHPADLLDEGADSAIARLQGEIAVDGICVEAVSAARRALRARASEAPRIAAHEAAVWFQPSARLYAHTRLRPNTASAIKSRNEFARICESAAGQGLSVRARLTPLDNAGLVDRHSTVSCVNVFGGMLGSRLCPSHPDVREYVTALVEDICANYPVDAIELSGIDFGPMAAGDAELDAGIALGDVGRSLLSWCFCAACRQRCGDDVDAEVAAGEIADFLEPLLTLQPPRGDFEQMIAGSAVLMAYQHMRMSSVSSLLRQIRRRCEKPVFVRASGDVLISGLDAETIPDIVDGTIAAVRAVLPGDAAAGLGQVPAARQILDVMPYPPQTPHSQSLVSWVREMAGGGVSAVVFRDYGLVPEPCLEWVRQAVRFARREAG